jgi:hypothetical protein
MHEAIGSTTATGEREREEKGTGTWFRRESKRLKSVFFI